MLCLLLLVTSVIRMEPDMSASGGIVVGDYPSSWSKVWKLEVVDLKALFVPN